VPLSPLEVPAPYSEAGILSESQPAALSFLAEEHGRSSQMRTYYRGPDALVTDDHFVWRTSSTKIYAVGELRNVGLVQGRIAASPPAAVLVTAAGLFATAAVSWTAFGVAAGYSVAALAVFITAATLAARHQRATRVWHLQATYRGIEVTLYSSSDVRMFNQVARALRRSIEDSRRTSTTYGLAAA
jgi:hypothetical protein